MRTWCRNEEHKVAAGLAAEAGVELVGLTRPVGGRQGAGSGRRPLSHRSSHGTPRQRRFPRIEFAPRRPTTRWPSARPLVASGSSIRWTALASTGKVARTGRSMWPWPSTVRPWSARWPFRHSELVLGTGRPPTLADAPPRPRIVVSRSRPPAFVSEVAEQLGAAVIPMGSAGAKIAAVIRGEAEIYLHAGGQYEWDSAAPVAVASPPGSTPPDSTARPFGTPSPTRGCRICWCAIPL